MKPKISFSGPAKVKVLCKGGIKKLSKRFSKLGFGW